LQICDTADENLRYDGSKLLQAGLDAPENGGRLADCKSAIRQIENLRYAFRATSINS